MLVLGRKPGEYVMIGTRIKVKVIKSIHGELRLAISAPRSMSIMRGELMPEQAPPGCDTGRTPPKPEAESGREEGLTLVLGRIPGETVMIGKKIKIEIIKCLHGRVRLAFTVPSHVTVTRGELCGGLYNPGMEEQ